MDLNIEHRDIFVMSRARKSRLAGLIGRALVVVVCLTSAKAFSQEKPVVLDAKTAKTIVSACEEFARENNLNMAIAVVDQGAHLLAFSRMDTVRPGVGKIALWKATSAALYGYSTSTFQTMAEKDQYMYHLPDAAPVGGGEPVVLSDGTLAGGVGVSGAAAELDVACAKSGMAAAMVTTE